MKSTTTKTSTISLLGKLASSSIGWMLIQGSLGCAYVDENENELAEDTATSAHSTLDALDADPAGVPFDEAHDVENVRTTTADLAGCAWVKGSTTSNNSVQVDIPGSSAIKLVSGGCYNSDSGDAVVYSSINTGHNDTWAPGAGPAFGAVQRCVFDGPGGTKQAVALSCDANATSPPLDECTWKTANTGSGYSRSAACGTLQRVVAGGCRSTNIDAQLRRSHAYENGQTSNLPDNESWESTTSPTGWFCDWSSNTGPAEYVAYALCCVASQT